MNRDPCDNPDTGDEVVTPDGQRRVVTHRRGYDIYYVSKGSRVHVCWITTWQEWCRKHQATAVTSVQGDNACTS